MFTELYQLIQKANLKNISLTLQDEGNGKMAVTVMTQNNVGDAADPKLRQALTQPLKVAASPMLLDEEFINSSKLLLLPSPYSNQWSIKLISF